MVFCASGSSIKTTVRTVYSFSVEEKDGKIEFTVENPILWTDETPELYDFILKSGEENTIKHFFIPL